VPRNHGPNITLLAALTPAGIGPALTITGSVNGAVFAAYVQQILAPSLRPGQVVMLDNLSAHKGEAVRLAVEGVGARLCFLSAYSPDFNPIELAFAKIKV
jgi:transposase